MFLVRPAEKQRVPAAAALAALLWPDAGEKELAREFTDLLAKGDGAVFLCLRTPGEAPGKTGPGDIPGDISGGAVVGFAQCGLRHDYVEGTDSTPVGYLEGVYVLPEHRGRGAGRALARACEDWARGRGCTEFASDCPAENTESIAFHRAAGFDEAGTIVCFVKKL